MTSIPFGTCRIPRNNLKRHYSKKQKNFLNFLLDFRNVHEIENILEKKMSILS